MVNSTPAVNGLQSTHIETQLSKLDLAAPTTQASAQHIAQNVIATMVKDGLLTARTQQTDRTTQPAIQDELQGLLEQHLNVLLQEHPIDQQKEPLILQGINQAISAMTDTTYVDMKHMKKAAQDELLNIAVQACNFMINPHYHLTLSAVFGGTQDTCRMRAVAYILAPLDALDKLQTLKNNMQDIGVHTGTATMKILSAHNAAISLNNYDASVEKNAQEIFLTLQKYIEATRPHLKDLNVIQYAYDSAEQEQKFLQNSFELAAKSIPQEIISQLHTMGLKHGGEEGAQNSIRYGLLHPYVSGDFSLANPQEKPQPTHNSGIISYGGSPEKRFNALRKIVTNSLIEQNPNAFIRKHDVSRLISIAGERAVYYKVDATDLSMLDVAEKKPEPQYSRLIKKDIALIKNDLGIHAGKQIGLFQLKSAQQQEKSGFQDNNLKRSLDTHFSTVLAKPKIAKQTLETLKHEYMNHADTSNVFHNTNIRILEALSKDGALHKVDKIQSTIESQLYPLLSDIFMQPAPLIQPQQSLLP